MKRLSIKKIFLMVTAFLVLLLMGFFIWIIYGTPIHDFRLWSLERQFIRASIDHPAGSILLERKSYLGGKSTHGDGVCIYAFGEVRSAPLGKEDVLRTYKDIATAKFPIKVFFADGNDWPYELPFVIWQEELESIAPTDNAVYIVYLSSQRHFLGDRRCDD